MVPYHKKAQNPQQISQPKSSVWKILMKMCLLNGNHKQAYTQYTVRYNQL